MRLTQDECRELRPEPLVRDYRVGLVVPRCGVNGAQVGEIQRRLRAIAQVLPDDGTLHVLVPGYDRQVPELGMQAEVLNVGRLHKVSLRCVTFRMSRGVDTAVSIAEMLECAHRCDEVWCCPEITHRGNSVARANAVYRAGQRGPHPARYKVIPPWVEMPVPPAERKPKPKKERTLW